MINRIVYVHNYIIHTDKSQITTNRTGIGLRYKVSLRNLKQLLTFFAKSENDR